MSTPPRVVIDDDQAAFERAVRDVASSGWHVVQGLAPSTGVSGVSGTAGAAGMAGIEPVVRAAVITDATGAEMALLAALDGDGLVIGVADLPSDVIDRLVDDLRRLGPVQHDTPGAPRSVLSPDTLALLGSLANGRSLGEAAQELGLSRRTADRRLAEARRVLGTDRTTEAVARARQRGWIRVTGARR